jgi:ABC-type multidrug transport system ATPase subunit
MILASNETMIWIEAPGRVRDLRARAMGSSVRPPVPGSLYRRQTRRRRRAIASRAPVRAARPTAGRVRTCVPIAYLDQHVTLLRYELSLLDNLKRSRPRIDDREAHCTLAAFAFRNSDALRRAGSLSGGERLRAGLACVLTASPTPQLLLLDEPTNHLDLTAVEELEAALRIYDGRSSSSATMRRL